MSRSNRERKIPAGRIAGSVISALNSRSRPAEEQRVGESTDRILVTHAAPDAFAPTTREMIEKLGYRVMESEDYEAVEASGGAPSAVLRLVDERRLGEVPDEGASPLPIVMLTGRVGAVGADGRVVGALRRPAGVHELYRLVQQLSEDTPRSTLRLPVHIPASCRVVERDWRVLLLSLSENGCLARSPEPMELGRRVELDFDLSDRGCLRLQAEVGYQLLPDFGLVFHGTTPGDRTLIRDYLTALLQT